MARLPHCVTRGACGVPVPAGRAGLGRPLSLFWIFPEVIWCREGTVTETPKFRPGQRVAPGEQQRLGRLLVIEYQSGKSIRQLCAQTGYSIGRMRRLLEAGGVTYRGRGTATRKRSPARE